MIHIRFTSSISHFLRGVAVVFFILVSGIAIALGYFGLKQLTETP
jgi:hypothetical protein